MPDADTNRAIGDVYRRIDADKKETSEAIQQGFKDMGDKLDAHKDAMTEELKQNREQVHKLDLAVQGATSAQTLCRAEMGPRVKTVEDTIKDRGEKVWQVARPILVKALEWAIMGGGFYLIYKALKAGLSGGTP
jgi:hypothetical protein